MKVRLVTALTFAALAAPSHGGPTGGPAQASGYVFHDSNGNGHKEPGEHGLSGIWVSDGRRFDRTNSSGKWSLELEGDDTTFFVIKPRGWKTPQTADNVPRFYYQHKPQGSPPLDGPGVPPTGELPASIDFPLVPSYEPDKFDVIVAADTQPQDEKELGYFARDLVEELDGSDAAFGIVLGDIVSNLDLFEPVQGALGLTGIPWYGVLGNHDLNFAAQTDEYSDETYERYYGPPTYSFEYGRVHFIVLDDVEYGGSGDTEDFHGRVSDRDLEFLAADVGKVPADRLIVLLMHIPLTEVENRAAVLDAIDHRSATLSLSGHAHMLEHVFLGHAEGWMGAGEHHHVVNAAACGSWWGGMLDGLGVPHTTMRDGAPNGYMIYHFDRTDYSIEFRPSREPADHQMNVASPDTLQRGDLMKIAVNVFNGSERSRVELRFGETGPWTTIQRATDGDLTFDPFYGRQHRREWHLTWLPAPAPSTHLWRAEIPVDLPAGSHWLHVRETDMFGKVHETRRVLRVTE